MTSHGPYIDGIYAATLSLSANEWLEQVTTDIPFLTIGIVALACVTCLLLTQRLSIPAACILTSAFLAFNGSLFDFARLLLVAKQPDTTSIVNSGPFAIVVLREISYSLSISLNYLFFLVYLGRPPRGEVQLVGPAERARARRESPARWAYWGVVGYLAQGVLAAAIVAVAVLGVIWRVTANPKGVIYMTNGVIEGVLSISFLGKVLLNAWLSPLTPQWKTIRNYSPLIFALATRLGIILTSEFCTGFTEASLGRLLQAIQLYILLVLVLVSPFYGPRRQDEHSEVVDTRRASSFRGLRFSKCSQWSTLNTAPGNDSRETQMPRGSPSERLSAWLTNRLTPRKDPQEDRLWNKDKPDLEAPPTPFDRNIEENDGSPIEPKFTDNPPAATWQGPYLPDPITPEGPNDPTTPITPSHVIDITENGFPSPTTLRTPPRTSRPPSDLMPPGRFIGKFEINQSYESDSDSPVYGINGIIQRRSQSKRRSRYDTNRVSAIYQLEKEKEELERSVASMAAFSPSKSELTRRTSSSEGGGGRGDAVRRDSDPSDVPASDRNLLSESIKSDFSLRDFPSPPGSVYPSNKGKALVSKLPTPPLSTKSGGPPEVSGRSRRSNDLEVVEDVQFAMVPPQMPAAASYSRRRASFPVVARESAISSVDGVPRIISAYGDSEDDFGGKRVRMSSANNRLDVTSFIGELTTPQAGKAFGNSHRNDSMDLRLSPLPEDTSSQPSAEIIDIRLKSPTFTPAIAISTNDKSTFETQRVPKVSFAPVTHDSSGLPRGKASLILSNTLPASPRPSASPSGSPRAASQFKPATSSPLSIVDRGPNTIAYTSSTTTGSRSFINGPMPLKTAANQNYQSPRPATNPSWTQRFL